MNHEGQRGKDGEMLAFHWGEDHMLLVMPEAANLSFQVGACCKQIELWRWWWC